MVACGLVIFGLTSGNVEKCVISIVAAALVGFLWYSIHVVLCLGADAVELLVSIDDNTRLAAETAPGKDTKPANVDASENEVIDLLKSAEAGHDDEVTGIPRSPQPESTGGVVAGSRSLNEDAAKVARFKLPGWKKKPT